MKKKCTLILFTAAILLCLLYPAQMARGAADGLRLWYTSVLPTLLPFSIFSSIIIRANIYPVRHPLLFPLIAGYTFGFPLGSKISAQLCLAGHIPPKRAEQIACISNNFGPAFLYNYALTLLPNLPHAAGSFLFSCYAPALILGIIWMKCTPQFGNSGEVFASHKKPTSRSQINFKIIDAGIMDGFTTMIKLAGYIMLAAIMAHFVSLIPLSSPILEGLSIGSIEITNGIQYLCAVPAQPRIPYVLCVGIINFGGISGLLQTSSMMKSTGFHLGSYLLFKLASSLIGMGLMLLFLVK